MLPNRFATVIIILIVQTLQTRDKLIEVAKKLKLGKVEELLAKTKADAEKEKEAKSPGRKSVSKRRSTSSPGSDSSTGSPSGSPVAAVVTVDGSVDPVLAPRPSLVSGLSAAPAPTSPAGAEAQVTSPMHSDTE